MECNLEILHELPTKPTLICWTGNADLSLLKLCSCLSSWIGTVSLFCVRIQQMLFFLKWSCGNSHKTDSSNAMLYGLPFNWFHSSWLLDVEASCPPPSIWGGDLYIFFMTQEINIFNTGNWFCWYNNLASSINLLWSQLQFWGIILCWKNHKYLLLYAVFLYFNIYRVI